MSPLQHKLRQALGSLKDQTSIGIAKVASNGAPDLEVAMVKATSHDEDLIEERYVQEILHLTSYSRGYVNACVEGLARRLGKTHNWVVAIKALMLTDRLLCNGNSSFGQELLYCSRHGMRVLNLSNFRDGSHSHAWDYSAFIRTYALFLDEKLNYTIAAGKSHPEGRSSDGGGRRSVSRDVYGYVYDGRRDNGYGHDYDGRIDDGDDQRDDGYGHDGRRDGESHHDGYGHDGRRDGRARTKRITSVKDMKPQELLERIPLMQRLLERLLACCPTGAARMNHLVQIALYPVVRESFQLYTDICDGLAIILDAFFDMEHADCVKAFDIYSRGAKQILELAAFYASCQNLGVCRSSEYPVVQKVSENLLETMEDFLKDRSEAFLYHRRKKIPEPRPLREPELDDTSNDVYGMKVLPAPAVCEEPDSVIQASTLQKQQSEPDLLGFDNDTISAEEHGDRLALALFSNTGGSSQGGGSQSRETQGSNGVSFGDRRPLAGWELALVESSSELSKPAVNTLAGGFDNLLLTSLYDQASANQKMASTVPSGSASSVALPGHPASSFLALPAPVTQAGDDPFAASLSVPPPPYVQMSDMVQKQRLLVQEQQIWYLYQRDGMQGHNGLMKYYNHGYNNFFQTSQPVPYYGTSYY